MQIFTHHLEATYAGKYRNHWDLVTSAPLEAVLAPAYWQRFTEHSMRCNDLVRIVASYGGPAQQYADVLVTELRGKVPSAVLVLGQAAAKALEATAAKRITKARAAA
jgi:hypothetical protein